MKRIIGIAFVLFSFFYMGNALFAQSSGKWYLGEWTDGENTFILTETTYFNPEWGDECPVRFHKFENGKIGVGIIDPGTNEEVGVGVGGMVLGYDIELDEENHEIILTETWHGDWKRRYHKKQTEKESAQRLAVTGRTPAITKDSKCPVGAVDLGIVMTRGDGTTYNLYWAKSNLCTFGLSANPEDYGDYYAWGETEPYYIEGHSQDTPCHNWKFGKSAYGRNSYRWFSGPANNPTVLKYNYMSSFGEVDNIRVLQRGENPGETIDDAARAKLGGKWRMPTFGEWKALVSSCKWTWTKNYNGTGVQGYIVTAGNGNSIFLPAAGRRRGIFLEYAGSYGSYWSSSLGSQFLLNEPYSPQFSPTSAQSINFYQSSVDLYDIIERSFGFSVRPVSE